MKITRCGIKQRVSWRISRDTAPILSAKIGGQFIVNPLFMAQTNGGNDALWVAFPNENEAIFDLSQIGLVDLTPDKSINFDVFVTGFLACLEDISGQTGLSSMESGGFWGYENIEVPENLHFPDVTKLPVTSKCKQFHIDTAITVPMIEEAAKMVTARHWPSIHRELLFDAVESFEKGDFRMSILLAAMAVETLAKATIETDVVKVLGQGPSSSFRMVQRDSGNGARSLKEPILQKLLRSAKNDFKMWLDEVPLYVRGKSLLDEQPDIYAMAIKLHNTRNKIVHEGYPKTEDRSKCFNISLHDTQQAIDCANKLFTWFGDRPICLGDQELVDCRVLMTPSISPLASDYQKTKADSSC